MEININRRLIEGCLNRMQCTRDIKEINEQASNLIYYLSKHILLNKKRILEEGENQSENRK